MGSFRRDGKKASWKFPERKSGFDELRIIRELLFPDYWNCGHITDAGRGKDLEAKIDEFGSSLFHGVLPYINDAEKARTAVDEVLGKLPLIREVLKKDAEAAYNGDPSVNSYAEIFRSCPGFDTIMIQRIAHELYKLGVPSYPRELTEHMHSITGIDIHPGASIGEHFFIDHGTGVVIGETSKIGIHVRIYQGVTLGALHFEKDESGALKKGYKRHPTIGSHVVIGMGAKILGPVKIGNHVSIGANSWIETDVPDYTTVFISEHPKLISKRNGKS